MDVLIFIGVILILVILLSYKSSTAEKLEDLKQSLKLLNLELENLKQQNEKLKFGSSKISEQKPTQIQPEVPKVEEKIKEDKVETDQWWANIPKHQEEKPVIAEIVRKHQAEEVERYKKEKNEPRPTFFERYPDLEKFIGENLINKIGIAVLVLGIAFFVKYAIDQQWIKPTGRVFTGLIAGGILLFLAHRIRKTYKAFSSVLIGGGMAVFYFTIAIAFHQFSIFDQTQAFIIMIIITAFTVLLSILYNRIEIAALAIIGGFATPFMVSQGEGNYIVLFTYLSVLNIGMLVLAYYKNWSLINLLCYVFTIILYGAWLVGVSIDEKVPVIGALTFATLFYITFFLMNIINNIKENRKFLGFHIGMLISNTFLYFSAGMSILENFQEGAYRGLFTAIIAIFNFAFAYTLYKNRKVDINLTYLLIGLTLTFISLTAPVQLEGNYITLFWSVETVLLLWLSQKSGIKLMKLASLIIMILMIISLVMDWGQMYDNLNGHLNIIFNKAFITTAVSLLSFVATLFLLKNEGEFLIEELETIIYKYALQWLLVGFLYVGLLLELIHHLNFYIESYAVRDMIIGSFNLLYIIGCMIVADRRKSIHLNSASIGLGVIGIMAFIIWYQSTIIQVRGLYLENALSISVFAYHYLLTGLILAIIVLIFRKVRTLFELNTSTGTAFLWYIAFVVLFIASAELDHLVVLANYSTEFDKSLALAQSHKIGYPILWGLSSFVLMVLGMKFQMKNLRIISLTLFFITLIKLFLFDIRGISEGGKIAAFICLGILLLIVSFMYQKLKNLILDGGIKTPGA